ncbi:T9SS type A sorting domain-containing protein [Psychroserpens sp. SPM9]|uniref:T9SS type A sorting domain-containing protein n=1 Tax=Psychroserpens sp. SPM9 TaxID=2975598 RepID=UPI0021A5C168|nr:T9SS type A sorting domain-containing protein [Psychroserpens sp. SPM9]MDG5490065.1 T9SS type A sorting domain-containing protein [Psychroserpens sp. SPM9]
MKKHILLLLLVIPIMAMAQGPWDFTNTEDGWVKGGGCTAAVGPDAWTLTTNGGNNPNLTNTASGIDADANTIAAITLRISAGGPSYVRVRIPKAAGGYVYKPAVLDPSETDFVTYYIDVTDAEWSGIEDDIRFQFKDDDGTTAGTNHVSDGETIEIDKIEFLSEIPAGTRPEKTMYEFNTDGDTEGWSETNSIISVSGGLLTLVPEVDAAAKIVQGENSVEAEENDFIHIVYKNESALNNQVRIQFRYPADGYTAYVGTNAAISQSMTEFETLSVNLAIARPDEWIGFVQDFQIIVRDTENDDVTNNGASEGNFIIDRIEFNKEPNLNVENSVFNNLVLYPNPSKNILNIKGVHDLSSVEIIDIQGRSILKYFENLNTIDVSTLNSGSYLVKVTSGSKASVIKKLLVE